MSLEAAIQSLADAIRDHAAALRGQGVLFPHDPVVQAARSSAFHERMGLGPTGPQGPQDPPGVETPVSGDRVAEIVEAPKRGRGRPPKNAPPATSAPVEPIVETMPLEGNLTINGPVHTATVVAWPEAPIGAEPEPDLPLTTENITRVYMESRPAPEPEPPVFAADAEPITRDKLRDYLMTVARPVPTIGTAGCQRIIQEHGGVAKLSEVPEDRLGAVYTAAVAAVLAAEAASDDLG